MKTADSIEELKAASATSDHVPVRKKRTLPKAAEPYKWKPGISPNPGGRPKRDMAAELARAVIEGSLGEAYKGLAKQLSKGNGYVFKELAERGYGKLKEISEVTHIHQETPDADLNKRIADLERDLGLARQIDEAGRIEVAAGRSEPTNGKAKTSDILS